MPAARAMQVETNIDLEGYLVLGVVFLLGLAVIYWGFDRYRLGRLIMNTPTQPARSIAQGRTEVHGRVVPAGETFQVPFGPGDCVYRRWSVQEEREEVTTDGDGTRHVEKKWHTVASGRDVAPFYVEDDTGRVLVEADAGADFEISNENSESITLAEGQALPGRVEAFFSESAHRRDETADIFEVLQETPMGALFAKADIEAWRAEGHEALSERQREALVRHLPEAYVTDGNLRQDVTADEVAGAFREEGDPEPDYGDGPMGRIRALFDRGRSVADAFTGGGSVPSRPSRGRRRRFHHAVLPADEAVYVFGSAEPIEGATGSNVERLRIVEDAGTGRFIISDRDESGLVKYYNRRAPLYILVGLAMSAGSLYFILRGFGVT
ncbi:MAG: GIDE domain-containing protein [Halobacteriales archaeon]